MYAIHSRIHNLILLQPEKIENVKHLGNLYLDDQSDTLRYLSSHATLT